MALQGNLQQWEDDNIEAVQRGQRFGLEELGELGVKVRRDASKELGPVGMAWGFTVYPKGRGKLADNPAVVIHPKGESAEKIFATQSKGEIIRSKDALNLWVPIPDSPADRPAPKNGQSLVESILGRVGKENVEIIPGNQSRPAMAVARSASIAAKSGRVGRGGRQRLKSGGFRQGTADVPLFWLLPQVHVRQSIDLRPGTNQIERSFPELIAKHVAAELRSVNGD